MDSRRRVCREGKRVGSIFRYLVRLAFAKTVFSASINSLSSPCIPCENRADSAGRARAAVLVIRSVRIRCACFVSDIVTLKSVKDSRITMSRGTPSERTRHSSSQSRERPTSMDRQKTAYEHAMSRQRRHTRLTVSQSVEGCSLCQSLWQQQSFLDARGRCWNIFRMISGGSECMSTALSMLIYR